MYNQPTVMVWLSRLTSKKAFDTVDHSLLIDKLECYGVRGTALEIFRNYLTDRQQYTVIGQEKSDYRAVFCGIPQGSVLGPTLFLLYINDITACSQFATTLFADDTHLLLSSSNSQNLMHIN